MLNPPSDSKNAVLIVDDSKDDIELLKRAFINAGVKNSLIIESTGEAALSHFAPGGHAPCIALVDLRMPGMDGFEVIRTIARNPTHKSVLLVAITPYDLHAIRKAYECGAHTSLLKPANPVDVRNLMHFFSSHWVIENPSANCG